jgi:manganese efflux pump family protein
MTELIIIAISLGIDAFSVAFAHGICDKRCDNSAFVRLSLAFGGFQWLMPIIGFYFGSLISPWLKQADIWIVATIIALIGVHMIREAYREENKTNLSRGWPLLFAAFATSLDAWAIGFSFAILNRTIWKPALLIGITAAFMTILGIWLGRSSQRFNLKRPGIWGGIALIVIALNMILQRIL